MLCTIFFSEKWPKNNIFELFRTKNPQQKFSAKLYLDYMMTNTVTQNFFSKYSNSSENKSFKVQNYEVISEPKFRHTIRLIVLEVIAVQKPVMQVESSNG